MLNKILKAAKTEADWLRYYGFREDRLLEKFDDHKFYDRIRSIGYTKTIIPLHSRCAMMCLTSNYPVLETNINNLTIIHQTRNHTNNIYTALEYLIYKNIEKDTLIKIIKS